MIVILDDSSTPVVHADSGKPVVFASWHSALDIASSFTRRTMRLHTVETLDQAAIDALSTGGPT